MHRTLLTALLAAVLLATAGGLAAAEPPVAEAADAAAAGEPVAAADAAPAATADDLEAVKQDLIALKRDLTILEEDLLFPASSQVAVYLSMDVGEFFQLDAVTVKLDGQEVTHHLYTDRQIDALLRGGVQRLYLGNVNQGKHELTAFFTGRGPSARDYRRAATVEFEKGFEPTFVELAIRDSESSYQPEFHAAVSN